MKLSPVSRSVKLLHRPGTINPGEVNEEFLRMGALIDDQNEIDRELMRIGSLGTTLTFLNESEDVLKVDPSFFEITSIDEQRIQKIFNYFKERFGSVHVLKGEYSFNDHYNDDGYPEIVFNKIVNSELFHLDHFRVKSGNIMISMWNCCPGQIHIRGEVHRSLKKSLSDIDLSIDFQMETLNLTNQAFIEKFIKQKVKSR